MGGTIYQIRVPAEGPRLIYSTCSWDGNSPGGNVGVVNLDCCRVDQTLSWTYNCGLWITTHGYIPLLGIIRSYCPCRVFSVLILGPHVLVTHPSHTHPVCCFSPPAICFQDSQIHKSTHQG